jgi:YggT family protein
MSFVMMFSGSTNPHPLLLLVWQLTEPVMAPVRKVIPSMGGLDFSPIFIFLAIQIIQNFILTTFSINQQHALVIIGI